MYKVQRGIPPIEQQACLNEIRATTNSQRPREALLDKEKEHKQNNSRNTTKLRSQSYEADHMILESEEGTLEGRTCEVDSYELHLRTVGLMVQTPQGESRPTSYDDPQSKDVVEWGSSWTIKKRDLRRTTVCTVLLTLSK